MNRRREALWIWLIHGPIDSVSTVIIYSYYRGVWHEANPIIRELSRIGPFTTIFVMSSGAGLAAVLWPVAAEEVGVGPNVARLVIGAGLLIVASNWVFALL